MIIDGHMHIGRDDLLDTQITAFLKAKGLWPDMQHKLSAAGVIEALDEAGIDQGVIFPLSFSPTRGCWQDLNELTASYVQQHPDRLIGFAIIKPQDVAESIRELDRAIDQLGLRGIKLHPSMQEFYPNDPSVAPIFEYAQTKQIPVLCHTGASAAGHSDKFSRPTLLDDVLSQFPELDLILAHAGRPFYDEACMLLRKYSHVHADISANTGRKGGEALLANVLAWIQLYAGACDRLIFGSDYPVFSPSAYLKLFRQALEKTDFPCWGLDTMTELERDLMMGGALVKLLKRDSSPREE